MNVFVTGATGYIGFSVATALRRAGHAVWGLARSADKARALEAAEVHPVIGTLQKPDSFRATAEQCSVLVHTAADMSGDMLTVDRQAVETLLATGKTGHHPKRLIYTSGCWVHGNTGAEMVDETSPLNPARLVTRRPQTEKLVLNDSGVRGLVIRPGCVYGGRGGLTGMWFAGAREGALRAIGDGSNRWTMVHVDDLADAYVRLAESNLAGEVFDVGDRSRSSVQQMVEAVARVSGYDGEIEFVPLAEAKKQMGDFAECLALDQHLDARKAVRLLGWQPKHGGFVDGIDAYYLAWQAAQAQ